MKKNEKDANYVGYSKYKHAYNPVRTTFTCCQQVRLQPCYMIASPVAIADINPLFNAAFATGSIVDPPPVSEIRKDGQLQEHDIQTTEGFIKRLLEPGDECFVILEPVAKHGDKYNALELTSTTSTSFRFQVSRSISAHRRCLRTTPHLSNPPATKPATRASKVTKINFDRD
jgi:hypothetical protein